MKFHISSLSKTAPELSDRVRAHWQLKNKLPWVLDVSFSEDASLIHTSNAAENFSLLRKIAMTWLNKYPSRGSIKGKRKPAGGDNN